MIELSRCNIEYDYIKQIPVEYLNEVLGYEEPRVILIEDKVLLATVAYRVADANTMVYKLRSLHKRFGLKVGIVANFRDPKCSVTPVRIR